jgi:hypothetical protein
MRRGCVEEEGIEEGRGREHKGDKHEAKGSMKAHSLALVVRNLLARSFSLDVRYLFLFLVDFLHILSVSLYSATAHLA